MKKNILGSILVAIPSLLTLFIALASWDTFLRPLAGAAEGMTGDEIENVSQYNSLGICVIIIPIVLAAIGILLMNKGGKTISKVFGGLFIIASGFSAPFGHSIQLLSANLTLGRIILVVEVLAVITGIILLALKNKR